MGSYYFSYRGHLITGIISSIIALLIFLFEIKLTNALKSLGSGTTIIIFLNTLFYIIINRVIYMSFTNPICIQIDKCKSKKIKDKEKLIKHKCKNYLYLLIHILISIIIVLIFKEGL